MTGVAACGPAAAPGEAAPPLPALGLAGVTVSGVSSGGFFAHQIHVAHAARIGGAGVIAAGPYGCAGSDYPLSFFRALFACARPPWPIPWFGPPDPADSIALIRREAAAGRIDDPVALADARVYLFSGREDGLVPQATVAAVGTTYAAFLDPRRIGSEDRLPAAHAMVTLRWGNGCPTSTTPFINDCDFDLAEAILAQVTETAAAPAVTETARSGREAAVSGTEAEPTGRLLPFDQRPFLPAGREAGLAATGYLYIPAACDGTAGCRLHVAFHGCNQDAGRIGEAFVRHAGYNHAGDRHRSVILYPQVRPLARRFLGIPLPWPNPQACWDWWGYSGRDFAVRSGAQMTAVMAMIDRLTAPAEEGQARPATP